ncbi:DUF7691 family protein [Streptomyces pseudogriseolus]|uniref:DUF7691 family protein n=1 Tax=Streptomyces pseudogriseolus TaxID=36817 RepID=UPI003FA33E54
MSRIISYNTAGKAAVLSCLGAGENLTPEQHRVLGMVRERAEAAQEELDAQGLDWGLRIPEALDHLLEGHANSTARYAAGAYARALQCIIDLKGSDPYDLGVYSRPATFFLALDEELRRAGVDEDLLLYPHVFSGPPKEIPFFLPHAVDGPHIGMFPLAKAGPAADAYRAVSGSVSPEFHDELDRFASLLESEHGEWEYATKALDWYDQDTIFFSITG